MLISSCQIKLQKKTHLFVIAYVVFRKFVVFVLVKTLFFTFVLCDSSAFWINF